MLRSFGEITMAIENFEEVRSDGIVLNKSMSVEDIFALGVPTKVVEIRWHNADTPITIAHSEGILAEVSPDRKTVAAIFGSDKSSRRFDLLNADGSVRHSIPTTQRSPRYLGDGDFRWFEGFTNRAVSVVFEPSSGHGMWRLEIDPSSGATLAVHETR